MTFLHDDNPLATLCDIGITDNPKLVENIVART